MQHPYRGCLSFAIHPHHVASTQAVQAVLHNLLMLYSFLDMQVCSFKVSLVSLLLHPHGDRHSCVSLQMSGCYLLLPGVHLLPA